MIATPMIVGDTVSGSPLEADEWVIAARAADLEVVLASNNADFTISQFTSTRTEVLAREEFRSWKSFRVDTGEPSSIYPGPPAMLPVSVVLTGPNLLTKADVRRPLSMG
ncbi:hypothetical protein [Salinibacterium sp.]|uniref:hypothetical protein n=1 Tax=Salinibacterium sp. TaxID=1915057 RepID=UPI00286B6F30|nr:hypothetical protein [Salinibacterium sp.]